jgi:hypothetical protein
MEPIFTKEQLWASNGTAKTNSLFTETARPGDTPIASLNGNTTKPVLCLRDFYVTLVAEDPSEVTFAETVFGDLRYWMKLKEAKFMPPYLEEWNAMADTIRKKLAFEAVIREIKEGGRSSFSAAKYIIEEPWKDKRNTKTRETSKKTTEDAHGFWKSDIERLKEDGLIQ